MTNEELERAIDFLLKSQAHLEAQGALTDERLRQLTEQVSSFADTQANIMRVMTVTFEAQTRINESLRASDESLHSAIIESDKSLHSAITESDKSLRSAMTESDKALRSAMTELATRQSRTEETLARLAEQTAGTDRRLEALIKIVEGQRGGG